MPLSRLEQSRGAAFKAGNKSLSEESPGTIVECEITWGASSLLRRLDAIESDDSRRLLVLSSKDASCDPEF